MNDARVWTLAEEDGTISHVIHCPACGYGHKFDKRWTFNGDLIKPTFRASMLVYGGGDNPRCHSFVTDGAIQYLSDCTHAMRGQTIDLPPVD